MEGYVFENAALGLSGWKLDNPAFFFFLLFLLSKSVRQ